MAPLALRALPEPLALLPQFVTPLDGKRHPPPPTCVALSSTCREAVVCVGSTVRLVDCTKCTSLRREEGAVRWTVARQTRTTCCAFSGDDATVAVGDALGSCSLFRAGNGSLVARLDHVAPESRATLTSAEVEGMDASLRAVAFSRADEGDVSDDAYCATAGADGSVHVWRVRDGLRQRVLSGESQADLSEAEMRENAMIVGWLSEEMRAMLAAGPSPPGYRCVTFAPNGLALAAGGESEAIHVWERQDGEFRGNGAPIRARAEHHWASVAMMPTVVLVGHEFWVNALAWARTPTLDEDGRGKGGGLLASLDIAGGLRLWAVLESIAGEDGRPGISSNPSTSPKSNSFSMILEPLIQNFPSSRRL